MTILALLTLLVCLFLLFAKHIIYALPVMKRLEKEKKFFSNLHLAKNVIENETMKKFCRKLLVRQYLKNGLSIPNIENYEDKYTIGQILEIVYYRKKKINRVIEELTGYGFIILILSSSALYRLALGQEIRLVPHIFSETAEHNFFELIPFFEFAMFLLFAIRLRIELIEINEVFKSADND